MKRTVAIILSALIILSSLTVGIKCVTLNISQAVEKSQIDQFWYQLSEFKGEISNRLRVKSKKNIDTLNAVNIASDCNDMLVLQFNCEKDLLAAEKYYASLDDVEFVERESIANIDDAEDALDTRCFAAATNNVDDALKLLNTSFDNLPEIKVAVIDTGTENSEVYGNRLVGGYDNLPNEDYHGSYVAGTLLYNTPDNVKIYSYKAGSGEDISLTSAAAAIDKAVSDGCKVINMSFGTREPDGYFYTAIRKAYKSGVILISSAGNDSMNLAMTAKYPAIYSEVLAVGNMTASSNLSSTSNYGSSIFTYAVGTNVRSSYRGEDVFWNGTSAAAPVVSAAVADIFCADSDLTFDEIKKCVNDTEMSPNEDNTSRDMIDAYAALKSVSGKQLEQASFSYKIIKNESTGYSDIVFDCDDNTRVYYYISSAGTVLYPLGGDNFSNHFQYIPGKKIRLNSRCVINAVAYSDNKAKSVLSYIASPSYNNNGFHYAAGSRSVSFCSLNEKIIFVPETINGNPVEKISKFCFSGNRSVEKIVLPKTIKEIGEFAFSNCPNLKKVIAPKTSECGRYAFANCINLREVIMPSVKKTYTGLFKNCIHLLVTQISEIDGNTSKNNKAFYGCNDIINYNSKNSSFIFYKYFRGQIFYKLNNSTFICESADEILYLWDEYYVNKKPQLTGFELFGRFDSTALFDVNNDGIVNAKDYAIIKKAASKK